jgi:hypothetical protein
LGLRLREVWTALNHGTEVSIHLYDEVCFAVYDLRREEEEEEGEAPAVFTLFGEKGFALRCSLL